MEQDQKEYHYPASQLKMFHPLEDTNFTLTSDVTEDE